MRSFGALALGLSWQRVRGKDVLLNQVQQLASRSNSALVSDVCASALRAFYNAPQRGR